MNNRNKGITLIALVITVIVLLILAGVTIATLTGDNGILTRAQEAKNKTEQAQKDEQNILNSYEDKINEYAGIDWNEVMTNAKAPEEQETTSKNVIGLGTNGRAVNMDLWTYAFDTVTNGYGLNSDEVFQNTEYNPNGTNAETIRTAGYKGTETNGKDIIIPQYISVDGGKTYNPVTSLYRTFYDNTNITTMPVIPITVTNMQSTFESCANLKECSVPNLVKNINWCWAGTGIEEVSEIPNSVIYMEGSFASCNSLEYANVRIPDKVVSLYMTFTNSPNLKEANLVLATGLENMEMTFYKCSNLTKGPDVIPENVTNMNQTFQEDAKLTGEMTIKASPTAYENIFRMAGTDENARIIIKAGENNLEFLKNMLLTEWYIEEHVVGEWEMMVADLPQASFR